MPKKIPVNRLATNAIGSATNSETPNKDSEIAKVATRAIVRVMLLLIPCQTSPRTNLTLVINGLMSIRTLLELDLE